MTHKEYNVGFLQRLQVIQSVDSDMLRRGRVLVNISLMLLGLILVGIPISFTSPYPLLSAFTLMAAMLVIGAAIGLARRGWVNVAGWSLVIVIGLAIAIPGIIARDMNAGIFYMILPVLIAGVVLRPSHIWIALAGVAVMVVANYLVLPGEIQQTSEVIWLTVNAPFVFLVVTALSALSSMIAREAFAAASKDRLLAQRAADDLITLNRELEERVSAQTANLRQAFQELEARMAEKDQLVGEIAYQRETIREMSIPVLPVDREVLVMPLIGLLDDERISDVQQQALAAIERTRARQLLLDITGVPIIDSQIAAGIMSVVQAARLLGCVVVLIGVRPEVAQSMVALGADLQGVQTSSDLQTALQRVRKQAAR